jgi:hypothetical protein
MRELPEYFGGAFGTIKAKTDTSFRKLISRIIGFYYDHLFNRHWGEQIRFDPGNTVTVSMVFQGLNRQQAAELWRPFVEWVTRSPEDFSFEKEMTFVDVPARDFWNAELIRKALSSAILSDDRPGSPGGHFLWAGDHGQVGWVVHGYKSAWLPASLLKSDQRDHLVDALFASSRHWSVSLHFNKGLAGAPPEELSAAKDTAMNPAVLDAFALAIIATGGTPAFPGIPGHEPDVAAARRHAREIASAIDELVTVAPDAGAYVSESDFFERSWQSAFWGENFPRLAAVKKKYDSTSLFFVHHGVGSETWSADGFTRLHQL